MNKTLFILINTFFILSFYCNPYKLPDEKTVDINQTAFAHYTAGVELYNEGNYYEAMTEANQAIALNQRFAQFYQLQGDIFRAQGNNTAALKAYDQAVKLRSNFTDVYHSMGQIYFIEKRFEDALRAFKKVIANDPSNHEMSLEIARCYIELNELEVAYNDLADYRRLKLVMNEDPVPEYYKLLGIVYYKFGRFKDAIPQFEKYIAFYPDNTNALFLLGTCYYEQKEFERGLNCFNC